MSTLTKQSRLHSAVRFFNRWRAPKTTPFFSAPWYLEQYPDVAFSGMDPWLHFHHHGRYEGRVACPDHRDFLIGAKPGFGSEIRALGLLTPQDEAYINWLMARRLALRSDWDGVITTLGQRHWDLDAQSSSNLRYLPRLMYCDALSRVGRISEADACLQALLESHQESGDLALMKSNLALRQGHFDQVLGPINGMFTEHELMPVAMSQGRFGLDHLVSAHQKKCTGPLVSIIVPAWNAENTIAVALSSLLNQTYASLEILVVDDASTDQTTSVVQGLAQQDPRIRLLPQTFNQGPFAVRNIGLAKAAGEFITVHDSDDWSHPEKIQRQVQALLDTPTAMVSQSAWVRVTDSFEFGGWSTPEAWQGWVHRNTSSLMLRRAVFNALGFWDEVRCSADGEYFHRIQRAWGPQSIAMVCPSVPMTLGRARASSLTRLPETHLLTVLRGLRHDYQRAYAQWHASVETIDELYLLQSPKTRPFPVSDNMLHRSHTQYS